MYWEIIAADEKWMAEHLLEVKKYVAQLERTTRNASLAVSIAAERINQLETKVYGKPLDGFGELDKDAMMQIVEICEENKRLTDQLLAPATDFEKGLRVFDKYGKYKKRRERTENFVFTKILIDPELISKEDDIELEKLGWMVDDDGYFHDDCACYWERKGR